MVTYLTPQVEDFEDEEESTTGDVAYIFECLREACAREPGGMVQYFLFVVDPESFAHTVENIFHFSFLVKVERSLEWRVVCQIKCTTGDACILSYCELLFFIALSVSASHTHTHTHTHTHKCVSGGKGCDVHWRRWTAIRSLA